MRCGREFPAPGNFRGNPRAFPIEKRHFFVRLQNNDCHSVTVHGISSVSLQDFSVDGDRRHLPGDEFPAFLQGLLCRQFQPSAAGHLHAHDRHALNVIVPDDLHKLLAVVDAVQLWTADQRNTFPDKVLMEIPESDAKLLIERYVENVKCRVMAENSKVSIRTLFRKLTCAENNFTKKLVANGYTDARLNSFLKKEKWILNFYDQVANKDENLNMQKDLAYQTKIFGLV